MKLRISGFIAALAMLTLAGFVGTGCDTTETADSVVITVTPDTAELHGRMATETFVAAGGSTNSSLALPLVWTVSDPNLGVIRSTAGLSAVYESTGKTGNNIVMVRDQGQAEGMATVIQR